MEHLRLRDARRRLSPRVRRQAASADTALLARTCPGNQSAKHTRKFLAPRNLLGKWCSHISWTAGRVAVPAERPHLHFRLFEDGCSAGRSKQNNHCMHQWSQGQGVHLKGASRMRRQTDASASSYIHDNAVERRSNTPFWSFGTPFTSSMPSRSLRRCLRREVTVIEESIVFPPSYSRPC